MVLPPQEEVKEDDPVQATAGAKRGRPQSEDIQLDLFNRPAGPPSRLLPPLEAAINIAGDIKQDTRMINGPGQFEA